LIVEFRGNAQTDSGIASTEWDFGDGTTDSHRTTSHTYSVPEGASESFKATFTVEDLDGDVGQRSLLINVASPSAGDDGDLGLGGSVKIILQDPRTGDVKPDTGMAPYSVAFIADLADLRGTLAGVTWYFGDDSSPVEAISTAHTYTTAGTYPASVKVVTMSSGGTTTETTATQVITVLADGNENDNNTNDNSSDTPGSGGGGGSSGACGVGMLMPFAGLLVMSLWRRR
jgi:PKD repeat protein